jgi:hypothetical protein
MGDGLRVPDPPVHLSEVIGVIEAVWGAGGWVPLPARRVKGWWSEVTRQVAAAIVVVALIFGPTLGRRAAGLLARVESALTGRSAQVNSTS